ncbi:MAG: twin transmembrane helix small protein [Aliidongia sp.]
MPPQAAIVPRMSPLLIIVVVALMLALLGVLATGIIQMFRGSDPRRSNKLMQYRIMLQFGLVMLMGLVMLVFQR